MHYVKALISKNFHSLTPIHFAIDIGKGHITTKIDLYTSIFEVLRCLLSIYLLIFELKNLGQKYTHLVLPHFAFYLDRYDHGPRRPMHLYEFESVLHFRKVLPKLQNFANIKLFQFRILRTKKIFSVKFGGIFLG